MIDKYQLSDLFQRISVLMQSDNYSKDYGTGIKYTPIEVHTIGYIADHPGCLSKDIAYSWGKSTSAVSQIIKHLKDYELITITIDQENKKKQKLFLTDKGRILDQSHRQYDNNVLTPILNYLLEKFDESQIETSMKFLEAYLDFYCHNKKNMSLNSKKK